MLSSVPCTVLTSLKVLAELWCHQGTFSATCVCWLLLESRTFFIGVVSFRSDEKNAKIASGLVQILAGAGVEVPDFLASFGSGGFGGAPASFGGTDIRGGAVASTAYEDEGW